jgi:riboflavin kinase
VEFVKEDGDASLSSQTRKYERFLKLDAFLELTGPVIRGFGRGSKMLGIPTANLDVVPLKQQIDKLAPGIYFGFAKISSGKHKSTGIHRTVMSIGYNPFFNDKRKSIEPWLLREFEEDFYDETLSVLVCAYVRAECNFTTVENLIERIRKDARVCEEALDLDLVEGLDSWKHWFEDDA